MPASHIPPLAIAALLTLSCISGAAAAAPDAARAKQLAMQHACLGCHAVDKKLVGPAYQDVAAKYKNDPGARDYLVQKIKNGGSGVWGQLAMPPNAGLSDAELQTLADWVLAGAPDK
jgi:cytochrome c